MKKNIVVISVLSKAGVHGETCKMEYAEVCRITDINDFSQIKYTDLAH